MSSYKNRGDHALRVAPALIRTWGLTKRYAHANVVDEVDLCVQEGTVYGFLGPNGAGKSTTIKLILGLVQPTSGDVELLGEDVRQTRRMLTRVGSMIEGPAFVPRLTGRENVALVADYLGAPSANVARCLDTVGLGDAADRRSGDYSLGMKQRLGIAIALVGSPRLLVLDEPTNGLDPAGVVEIRQLITRLAREHGITVMVSSHILHEIEQMADDVGIIQHGRLRYQGTLAGLDDHGQFVLRVSDPHRALGTLQTIGLRMGLVNGELVAPFVEDRQIALAVRTLASSGYDVYRVEHRRRSLEETFLRLTDPAWSGTEPGLPATPRHAVPGPDSPVGAWSR